MTIPVLDTARVKAMPDQPLRPAAPDQADASPETCAPQTVPPSDTPESHAASGPAGLDLPVRAWRYEVRGLIGQGGMGEVYRAHDPDLGRPLALKLLRADLAGQPGVEQRFFEEARVTARLQHPG